ncbi:MAG: SH3-like domain-containing protein, partial [Carnobacterium sp.]
IIRNWFSIDTKPWGQSGFKNVSHTRNYVETQVHVTRQTGDYALISVNGKILGWVDKKALNS